MPCFTTTIAKVSRGEVPSAATARSIPHISKHCANQGLASPLPLQKSCAVRYLVPRPQDQFPTSRGIAPTKALLHHYHCKSLTRSGTWCRDRKINPPHLEALRQPRPCFPTTVA